MISLVARLADCCVTCNVTDAAPGNMTNKPFETWRPQHCGGAFTLTVNVLNFQFVSQFQVSAALSEQLASVSREVSVFHASYGQM